MNLNCIVKSCDVFYLKATIDESWLWHRAVYLVTMINLRKIIVRFG